MLEKQLHSMKKLGKKVRANTATIVPSNDEHKKKLEASARTTPIGTFPMYVGKSRQRFVIPTSYLAHPLFKILLAKVYSEFRFAQRNGLVVPCSVTAFQEIITAVENSNGFDFGDLIQEFI